MQEALFRDMGSTPDTDLQPGTGILQKYGKHRHHRFGQHLGQSRPPLCLQAQCHSGFAQSRADPHQAPGHRGHGPTSNPPAHFFSLNKPIEKPNPISRLILATIMKTQRILTIALLEAALVCSSSIAAVRTQNAITAGDWPSVNHDANGSRYSALKEIDSTNVGALNKAGTYTFPDKEPSQTAPVVIDGVIYATTAHKELHRLTGDLMMSALFDDQAASHDRFADMFREATDWAIRFPGNVFKQFQWMPTDCETKQFRFGFEKFAAGWFAQRELRKLFQRGWRHQPPLAGSFGAAKSLLQILRLPKLPRARLAEFVKPANPDYRLQFLLRGNN